MALNIVGISGNVRAPSRTSGLVGAILQELAKRDWLTTRQIDMVDAAPVLFRALRSDQLDDAGREIVDAVENADALVVGSPVYRASYTGALKHLFDLVDYRALTSRPVILAATGGTPLHGLMPDHQLRPLFAFFKALPLSTPIYGLETDFEGYSVSSPELRARIVNAANELSTVLQRHGRLETRGEAA
jgi:FMN reductase